MVEAKGDPRLERVVALQERDGRWLPGPALTEALGGLVPDPPEGINDWRWATALATAFLKRRPEEVATTQAAFERGQPWVKPSWLARAARQMLPPVDCYFAVDPALARSGRWQDSADLVFASRGFQGFVRPPAAAHEAAFAPVYSLGARDEALKDPPPKPPKSARVTHPDRFKRHQVVTPTRCSRRLPSLSTVPAAATYPQRSCCCPPGGPQARVPRRGGWARR